MSDADSTSPPPPPSSVRTTDHHLLAIAAAASAGAGLVHAAAAGTHAGDRALVLLFSITGAVQVAWAVLAATRANRVIATAGVAINLACAAAWVASRTVGLPLFESLREVEAIGTQDLLAAVLAGVSVAAAAAATVPVIARRRPRVAWTSVAALAALGLAVPGMAAEHTHGASHDHDHGTETAVATADGTAATHEHNEGGTDDHDHADAANTEAAADQAHDHADAANTESDSGAGDAHDHGAMPARLDHEPTEQQQDDARELVADTRAAIPTTMTTDEAKAAGYVSIGDGRRVGRYEHFINHDYLANDTILDPTEPESLVFRHNADGSRTLTTAMYILPPGSTMDDVPDIAGNLTMWHGHDNLCFDPATGRISGRFDGTTCTPGGVRAGNIPMLHVWLEDNECGPFAGTDNSGMTGSCVKGF